MLLFKPKEFSQHDLSLYFENTIVRVHENGKPPRWMSFVEGGKEGITFSECGKKISFKKDDILLEQIFPVGLFNTKTTVLFGERTGARQVTKGICKNNYSLLSMEKILSNSGMFKSTNASLTLALHTVSSQARSFYSSEIFNLIFEKPRYFSLEEAFAAIRTRTVFSRALSSEFALVPHPYSKDFLIFRNDIPVAELVSKKKIKIIVEEFRQECFDFFVNEQSREVLV